MIRRPIKLCIAALGGQGGGVLAEWLIEIAESERFLVQSTSVPGVAQRTGATLYYLEFFPRLEAERAGREPIMALMPVPGDVDCVVASELVEAGRAVQRGLVSERTILIASLHRSYAISEKSALGAGIADEAALTEILNHQGKRRVLFDMERVAEQHQSIISSVLLGAICGSGILPFARSSFEAAIRKSGIAVATNLAAFADACQRSQQGEAAEGTTAGPGDLRAPAQSRADGSRVVPERARAGSLEGLLERVRRLPASVQALALEGTRRAIDYQDREYASLYLTRLERIVARDQAASAAARAGAGEWALAGAVARSLALWMTFEDTIRVADLKTRPARFARVRSEVRAAPDQLLGITEFMKPRVEEIAGTLPARIGERLLASPRLSRWCARWTRGRRIRTSTVGGFLLLYALGGLRRWRRGTLRYRKESARIEDWLARIESLVASRYDLAVELARAQRLIKGYGDTHERGWRNFCALLSRLDALAGRADGAAILARLHDAALADEDGEALARALAALGQPAR